MHSLKNIPISFIILFTSIIAFSQQVTGDKQEVKELIVSSNEITTLLYNYGSLGRQYTLPNMVWNDLGYMYEFGPLISAEVIGENGETLHITSDSFVEYRQGDYSHNGTEKWGWLPRAGYSNPNSSEIANSLNPESWPSEWNYWPGKYGVPIADNEIYYVMDDFSNAEFNYYPFPDDTTKRGLGVKSEVRMYQYNGFLKDALIIKYKITNESPKDLSKVYFGFQGDPNIGGFGDHLDDMTGFLPNDYEVKDAANTIFCYDKDSIGVAGKPPGYFGLKLLNTPNNLGLTSFHVVRYENLGSNPNVPKNDPLMWQWLSAESIDTFQELLRIHGDNIINFGTGPFELKSGESKEIELAIFMSDDFDDMLHDAFSIQHYINWPMLNNQYDYSDGDESYKIELNELQKENEGSIHISWSYTGTNPNAKIFLDYSSDGGVEWTPIVKNHSINENYIWDTKLVDDGVNYILRVLAYNPHNTIEYYYDNCNERFTINNQEKNSIPEFKFIQFADTLRRERVNVEWISEDADNSELTISVEHSTIKEGPFNKIYDATKSNGKNSFSWNLSTIPNYETNYLRFSIKDDASETVVVSDEFIINIRRGSYESSKIEHIIGEATAEIQILVADTNAINNNRYEITFAVEDEGKKYSVRNINTNKVLIDNMELINGMSSPSFEGLRLNIKDTEINIDYNSTHFNRKELEQIYNVYFAEWNDDYAGIPHVKSDLDWIVVFNDLDKNADGSWVNIGDSTLFIPREINGVCPFRIIDIDNGEKANYLIQETINVDNSWDSEEQIILRPQILVSDYIVSYALKLDFSTGIIPKLGDTLYIVTFNPIGSNDVFQFQADDNYILSNNDEVISPDEYQLYQNYPNPFNPSTVIKYSIPSSVKSDVKLVVFDILGRKVATLVNGQQRAGSYEVHFDASHLTSGIYFYRLQSGSFVESKKMLLLK